MRVWSTWLTQVRILSRPKNFWARGHGNVVKALTDFVALNHGGECRKDYITLAANQRASWSVMTPAVERPCSIVFPILSPLFLLLAGVNWMRMVSEYTEVMWSTTLLLYFPKPVASSFVMWPSQLCGAGRERQKRANSLLGPKEGDCGSV